MLGSCQAFCVHEFVQSSIQSWLYSQIWAPSLASITSAESTLMNRNYFITVFTWHIYGLFGSLFPEYSIAYLYSFYIVLSIGSDLKSKRLWLGYLQGLTICEFWSLPRDLQCPRCKRPLHYILILSSLFSFTYKKRTQMSDILPKICDSKSQSELKPMASGSCS